MFLKWFNCIRNWAEGRVWFRAPSESRVMKILLTFFIRIARSWSAFIWCSTPSLLQQKREPLGRATKALPQTHYQSFMTPAINDGVTAGLSRCSAGGWWDAAGGAHGKKGIWQGSAVCRRRREFFRSSREQKDNIGTSEQRRNGGLQSLWAGRHH